MTIWYEAVVLKVDAGGVEKSTKTPVCMGAATALVQCAEHRNARSSRVIFDGIRRSPAFVRYEPFADFFDVPRQTRLKQNSDVDSVMLCNVEQVRVQ